MIVFCVEPKQPGDLRYVQGASCTWHGPIAMAAAERDGTPACPHCGGALLECNTESAWWGSVVDRQEHPDAASMLQWSAGKCFPDLDTLENAWRQSLEVPA